MGAHPGGDAAQEEIGWATAGRGQKHQLKIANSTSKHPPFPEPGKHALPKRHGNSKQNLSPRARYVKVARPPCAEDGTSGERGKDKCGSGALRETQPFARDAELGI